MKKTRMPSFEEAINILTITGNKRCITKGKYGPNILGMCEVLWEKHVEGNVLYYYHNNNVIYLLKDDEFSMAIPEHVFEVLKE